jgi:CcmD family protein
MEGTLYLFFAFSVTWIALFIYIHSMFRRQKSIESQIEKITEFIDKDQTTYLWNLKYSFEDQLLLLPG